MPAFDESDSIANLVKQIFSNNAFPIVVDDGSSDDTSNLAQAAGAHVIRHTSNLGYDAALATGIQVAIEQDYSFIVTMDADGQHDANLLQLYKDKLRGGSKLVIGVRDNRQRWSENLFSKVAYLLWGINDPLCGMKGYCSKTLAKMDTIITYESIGTELAIRLVKAGVVSAQLPVRTRAREGISRFGSGFRANTRIVKALVLGLFCPPAFILPS